MSDIENIIKQYTKDGNDFGFSEYDETSVVKQKVIEQNSVNLRKIQDLTANLTAVEELIMPFLVNLMKAKGNTINWPQEKRKKEISIPKSINKLEDYQDDFTIYKKGTPIHVRGALVFNDYIKKNGLDKQFQKISTGEKIKHCYLVEPNPVYENVISFITEMPEELTKYIDYDEQWKKVFEKPYQEIFDIIGWSTKEVQNIDDWFS